MKLPKPQGSFVPAPAGTHLAVCFRLVDLGTQSSELYGDKRQIVIGFELPDCQMDDGTNFSINHWCTLSMHPKATLRNDLIAWRGRDFTDDEFETFDLKNIIGASCLVSVVHNNDSARVSGISALPSGMQSRKQQAPTEYFSFDEATDADFDTLGEWLQEKIGQSPEFYKWRHPSPQGQTVLVKPTAGQPAAAVQPTGALNTPPNDDEIPF